MNDMQCVLVIGVAMLISGVIGGWLSSALRGQFLPGFIGGFFLGFLGWLFGCLAKDIRPRCQACLSLVPQEATKCRHCGELLVTHSPPPLKETQQWVLLKKQCDEMNGRV